MPKENLEKSICPWKPVVEKDKSKIENKNEPMLNPLNRPCYQCNGSAEEMSKCSYLEKSNQESGEPQPIDEIGKLLENRKKNRITDYSKYK